jgi:hypothetical protein
LARGIGNEPALQGLLRVYKDYYPDIIVGTAAISRNSFPPVRAEYLFSLIPASTFPIHHSA